MTRRTQRGLVGLVLIASVSIGQPFEQTGAAQKPQTKPVDVELLKRFLPELNGWTKVRTRGEQLTTPYVISNARAHYTSGASTMDIVITDSALNESVFAPFAAFMAAGYEERTDRAYKKSAVIAGSPGFESWEKADGHGDVTAVVANRFLVQASGRRVADIEPVRRAIAAVDLRTLATLK
jgi:hypothetical protein